MQATPIWIEPYKKWWKLNKWITDNSKGLNQGQKAELLNSISRYFTSLSFRRQGSIAIADAIHKKFYDELADKKIKIKGEIRQFLSISVPNIPKDFMVQNGVFKCGDFYQVLSKERYDLLRARGSDEKILCMLLEYSIYVSPSLSWQIPREVYEYMKKEHGLTLEGCASPVNSQILPLGGKYCSPSFYSDAVFGSIGDLFVNDLGGEVSMINPPFVEDFMEAVAIKIEAEIKNTTKNTTVVFVGPKWADAKFYTILSSSPHLKVTYQLLKGTHSYEDSSSGKKIAAKFNSVIFILSNKEVGSFEGLLQHFK